MAGRLAKHHAPWSLHAQRPVTQPLTKLGQGHPPCLGLVVLAAHERLGGQRLGIKSGLASGRLASSLGPALGGAALGRSCLCAALRLLPHWPLRSLLVGGLGTRAAGRRTDVCRVAACALWRLRRRCGSSAVWAGAALVICGLASACGSQEGASRVYSSGQCTAGTGIAGAE